MYRLLIAILLCLQAASPAPQHKDSDVTYVKIQPVVEDTPLQAAASTRESRIEKLPLTIPGNLTNTDKEPDKEDTKLDRTIEDSEGNIPEVTTEKKLEEPSPDLTEPKLEDKNISDASDPLEESETNQSEQIASTEVTTDDLTEVSPTDDLSVSHSENQADTFSETSDRRGRNFESIDTTETVEYVTERYEDEIIDHTVIAAPRTKAPPKFIPKTPKLSYYPKPKVFKSYSANHLEIVGKRKFRSRCSCQKIWNCPKLQISVPRCPDEYFLCCF